MKIRATTILSYPGVITGDARVSCRLEISWDDSEDYLNLGIDHRSEEEWLLLVSLMVLGAREAGVDFVYEDLRNKVWT